MLLIQTLVAAAAVVPGQQGEVIDAILQAFDSAWVVAIGENHGHAELHELLLALLEDPRTPELVDDIAVEWGNALYQPIVDRYVRGDSAPWDSLTMAWRNTIVSPNTVWDAPMYAQFFRAVRLINESLDSAHQYRVLLVDSPVDWSVAASVADLRPFFDRATSMAEVIRKQSLLRGRRSLFIAGGLHVARRPRVRLNRSGVPIGEVTPVAWLELRHPGCCFVFQSMGAAARLGVSELIGDGAPRVVRLDETSELSHIEANRTTTLRDRDGSRPRVYGDAVLADIVDAVILWDMEDVTLLEPDPSAYSVDWYWTELNRRSLMLRGQPMDSSLRSITPP